MWQDLIRASAGAAALVCLAVPAQSEGDPESGAQHYRACVACHSLEPGVHLTGPSLAGLWGRRAGTADGYIRYSQGLKSAEFDWDETTLNAWLAEPDAFVPGTYMVFPGIKQEAARSDLIAFLAVAMGQAGKEAVIEQGLLDERLARGQTPDPLAPAPPGAQVSAIRHCQDSYFVTTADGTETPYWEMNLRLKLDSRRTGPEPGKPVIVGAGMMGDRVSVVFSSISELTRFVAEKC